MTAAWPVEVLVVDEHEVVCLGLVALLDGLPGFRVAGHAATVAAAVAEAVRLQPDLVLMDVRLPDGSGVDACRAIRGQCPAARVVMLTAAEDEETVRASIAAGASGYLPKRIRARELVAALESVCRDGGALDAAGTDRLVACVRSSDPQPACAGFDMLTAQERRILPLLAEGLTNKAIARAIGRSDKTVKNHVSSILGKLHAERRAQAAAIVVKAGMRDRNPWSS
jgi:two-component system, NarL family, response regulator DevR